MHEAGAILLDLFIIYAVARLAGELFERAGQPAVIGELLAGAVIGPYGLGLIGTPNRSLVEVFHGDPNSAQEALDLVYGLVSELGVVVLLFTVGLETRLDQAVRVGGRALLVATAGVLAPFALGFGLIEFLGHPRAESLFIGAAMVATSVGITARVLRDLHATASREARIILGAAVIDDILGLMVLAIVVGLAATGRISGTEIGLIVVQAVAFTVLVVLIGVGAIRRLDLHLDRLRVENAPLAVALITMLGLAALASRIGLAAIVGAFLAGMVFAESRQQQKLHEETRPIYQFLAPFFFVITGSHVDWRVFLDGSIIGLALVITVLAILGKVVGCGLPVIGLGWRSAAIIGVGMAPRGEVGLIIASVGRSLEAVSDAMFSVVVVMSVLTTLLAPPVLRVLLVKRREEARAAEARGH
jgi:Kef-type K+ transport system membrane component KefB